MNIDKSGVSVDTTLYDTAKALLAIEGTQGTNNKLALAESLKNTAYLKDIVYNALSKRVNFWVRKIPEPSNALSPFLFDDTLGIDFLEVLSSLSSRKVTGNAALTLIADTRAFLGSGIIDDLFVKVLNRDLKTGLGTTQWNKIYGEDFFPKVGCMKARENTEKNLANIKWPAYAQTKYDGTRMIYNMQVLKGTLDVQSCLESRNGSQFYFLDNMTHRLNSMWPEHRPFIMNDGTADHIDKAMIDGEIVFRDISTGKLLDRATSNGLATRCIKGVNSYNVDLYEPVYIIWDIVINDQIQMDYKERFEILQNLVNLWDSSSIILADNTTVDNLDEARLIYEVAVIDGEEGIILKNIKAPWSDNRSKHLVKFKEVIEVDLKVIGIQYGKTLSKYEKVLGYAELASDNNTIHVNVGSGFSDADRKTIIENIDTYIGQVCTVRCNALIKATDSDTYSLFLPTFLEWRFDKNETNEAGDFIL